MLWISCFIIPAMLWKVLEWIYYTLLGNKRPEPEEAETEKPIEPPAKVEDDEPLEKERTEPMPNTAEEPCKEHGWWKACASLSWSYLTRMLRVWDVIVKSSWQYIILHPRRRLLQMTLMFQSLCMSEISWYKVFIKLRGRYFVESIHMLWHCTVWRMTLITAIFFFKI